jgi:hypothetical protein
MKFNLKRCRIIGVRNAIVTTISKEMTDAGCAIYIPPLLKDNEKTKGESAYEN